MFKKVRLRKSSENDEKKQQSKDGKGASRQSSKTKKKTKSENAQDVEQLNAESKQAYIDKLKKCKDPDDYVAKLHELPLTAIQRGHLTREIVDEGVFNRSEIRRATERRYRRLPRVIETNKQQTARRYHSRKQLVAESIEKKGQSWSEDEYAYILDHPDLYDYQLAKDLGRSLSATTTKRRAVYLAKIILKHEKKQARRKNVLQLAMKDVSRLTQMAREMGIELNRRGVKRS